MTDTITVTEDDFFYGTDSSTIVSLFTAPRQSDGSLPAEHPLTLAASSDLIDAGVDVGLSFSGQAPDIGAYEYGSLSIELTSPSDGDRYLAPANIVISARINDLEASIQKVEFFSGTQKLGERTSSPWSMTWSDVPEGKYSLTAVVTNGHQVKTTSDNVNIVVRDNLAPDIRITSPVGGSVFFAPASITISADANDPDGSITKVEFFNGSTKLGEKTSSPWSLDWNQVPAGNYSLTAVATDEFQEQSTSQSIDISVNQDISSFLKPGQSSLGINLFPNPNNGIFTLSIDNSQKSEKRKISIVSIDGKVIYNGILLKDQNHKQFHLSEIVPGAYILVIYSDTKVQRVQFFMQ